MSARSDNPQKSSPLQIRSYGAWGSPIDAELVASTGMGPGALPREIKSSKDSVSWIEFVPGDPPRYSIMTRSNHDEIKQVTPSEFSARSRVHEYGGGAYDVLDDTISFVNDSDQRIYLLRDGELPLPITPATTDCSVRFADLTFSPDGTWLAAVEEVHGAGTDILNQLILMSVEGENDLRCLQTGEDFYSTPRFRPDGNKLAWLSWNHPNMPWDATRLWCADFSDGELGLPILIAGGPDESIYQPCWSPDGCLYFVSDRSGWWNIYRVVEAGVEPVLPMEAEFGQPSWLFGFSNYAFLSNGDIVAVFKEKGIPTLGRITVQDRALERFQTPYTAFELPSIAADTQDHVWFLAGTPFHPPGLILLDPNTGVTEQIHQSSNLTILDGYAALPRQVEFDSTDGRSAYGYFYSPTNPRFQGPDHERPPLIVTAHGGPISCARPYLDPEILFWTSRGFAFFDVDYAGSTGYGTAYRRSLDGQWGVADIEDCVNGARYLADRGLVDGDRLLIRGSSAGGYVVLAALTFHDIFRAGASYYGIGDLISLAAHIHKFEARTMDRLVGPLPEASERYRERSPLWNLDRLNKPVILFQGLADKVVPPTQSDEIAAVLKEKKLPYAYLRFEGEGHGFRKTETVINALEAELEFYLRVLDIKIPASSNKLLIHNL